MWRVGAVGYGAFGAFVLGSLRQCPDVQIWVVAGRSLERLKRFSESLGIPRWTTDWQSLVSDPKLDIVAVLTPPDMHAPIAIAAAEQGKHLFLEKPIALSLEEADKIIAAVEKGKVKAVVNHIMRYHPLYTWLKGRIGSLDLGSVRKVWFFNFASCQGLAENHWFWDERRSGGILVEHGVHFYHLFAWLLGEEPQPIATFRHRSFEAWSIVRFPNHQAWGEFYHCFDKPSALERNLGGIAFERGYASFEGWLPLSVRLTRMGDRTVVTEERSVPMDKEQLYRRLIRTAFEDLLSSIQDPNHQVTSDLASARSALAVALRARELLFTDNLGGCCELYRVKSDH